MLVVPAEVYAAIVADCLDAIPLEACGLLSGHAGPTAMVTGCHPATNVAASARVYTVEPLAALRADRASEEAGTEILGVYHSHTHTDAYPSPTDVSQAPDPDWHYVLVSLRDLEVVLRSYSIVDGKIEEESVVLQ